jgi:hypothetical protein
MARSRWYQRPPPRGFVIATLVFSLWNAGIAWVLFDPLPALFACGGWLANACTVMDALSREG